MVEVQANVPDAAVSLDGAEIGRTPLPTPVRLMPGAHVLVASKPGYERQVVELKPKPGERLTEWLAMLTEEEGAATRKAVQLAEERQRVAQQALQLTQLRARKEREDRAFALRTAGWAGLGAGAAAGVAAVTLGILSMSEAQRVSDAADGTPWTEVQPSAQRASTYRTAAWSCAAGAGALAIAGAVLVVGWYHTPEPKVVLAPAPFGLAVAGTF